MAAEKTLSIIKPDGVGKNLIGRILSVFEQAGLKIIAARYLSLSKEQAAKFYDVHKERPFYQSLIEYMTSGPVFVSVLEGENAVALNRQLMGATDPNKAEAGTIRALFADNIERNIVHGSDSVENAQKEVTFFFPEL